MKLTFLIQPNVKQLVLTPESLEEKSIFKMFPDKTEIIEIKRGSFFDDCRGGWVREFPDTDSLILIIRDKSKD